MTSCHTAAASRRPGFSLFELLVVVCLMVLLAGIALPALTTWLDRQQLDQSVGAFMITLNNAVAQAGLEGEAWTLELELSGSRYRTFRRQSESVKSGTAWQSLPEGLTFQLPDSDNVFRRKKSPALYRIEFQADGRSAGTRLEISRGQHSRLIELHRYSGMARQVRGV